MERTADYADAPGSPLHPDADTEITQVSTEPISEDELDFLELNPGIDGEDASEVGIKDEAIDEASDETSDELIDVDITGADTDRRRLSTPHAAVPLSKLQQTRFITYVEEQQLQIQRKLVQSSLNTNAYTTLSEALHDITTLLDFIWLSVGDNYEDPQAERTLFAQTQLLLALAVLPLDALLRVPVTQAEVPRLLALLRSLDDRFARLIDGKTPGGGAASATETVRFGSVANQTRVLLEEEFTARKILGFELELATVYEKVLERTGVL